MNRWILNGIGLSAVGALSLCGWTFYQVGSATREIRSTIAENRQDLRIAVKNAPAIEQKASDALPTAVQTASVLSAVNGTLGKAQGAISTAQSALSLTSTNINRPCKGPAGADACGTLAQFNKTVIKAGDAIVTTQTEEIKVLPHTTAAMDALNIASRKLGRTADSATVTIGTMNTQLKAFAVGEFSDHLNSMMKHGDAILGDGQKLADEFVAPKPWYRKILPSVSDAWDIGAAAARSLP